MSIIVRKYRVRQVHLILFWLMIVLMYNTFELGRFWADQASRAVRERDWAQSAVTMKIYA